MISLPTFFSVFAFLFPLLFFLMLPAVMLVFACFVVVVVVVVVVKVFSISFCFSSHHVLYFLLS